MVNLIAYVPVLNQRHLDWFDQYPGANLYLISQEMAEDLLPRLGRNIGAVPTDTMLFMLDPVYEGKIHILRSLCENFFPTDQEYVFADEEVSHLVAEKYFKPQGINPTFEEIWARWDMSAVKKQSPVLTGITVRKSYVDNIRMDFARAIAPQSPDWWRQVGAAAFRRDTLLACAYNMHMPNEYTTYIMGDPRINNDAGQPGGVYSSIHAEKAVVALCAKDGVRLDGASLYVTTFPCEICAREIALAGIKKVYFEEGYSTFDAQEVLESRGVEIIRLVKR